MNMTMKKAITWRAVLHAATILALCLSAIAGDTDLVVVVNKANPTNNLTKSQLRKLVLGEEASWPGGRKVLVVLQAPGTPERDGVLRSVCRMTEDDYNQHQMHANFSGETNTAPKVVGSAALVRQVVVNAPGAIGFLRPADVDGSVKAISVDAALAGQPDYKIKAGK
jgi:ABC-type phosphate transport system substrate-binding protein